MGSNHASGEGDDLCLPCATFAPCALGSLSQEVLTIQGGRCCLRLHLADEELTCVSNISPLLSASHSGPSKANICHPLTIFFYLHTLKIHVVSGLDPEVEGTAWKNGKCAVTGSLDQMLGFPPCCFLT